MIRPGGGGGGAIRLHYISAQIRIGDFAACHLILGLNATLRH